MILISTLSLLGGSHKHLFGLLCNITYLGLKVVDLKKFKKHGNLLLCIKLLRLFLTYSTKSNLRGVSMCTFCWICFYVWFILFFFLHCFRTKSIKVVLLRCLVLKPLFFSSKIATITLQISLYTRPTTSSLSFLLLKRHWLIKQFANIWK